MCRRVVVWRVVCARSYAVVSMAVSVTRLSALPECECGVVVAVCAVACLSVRVSPSRGGLPLCHACVWAENDSRVVWFVKLGVS